MKNLSIAFLVLAMLVPITFCKKSFADETVTEKVETGVNKASDSVKRTYRKGKDKACEMLNGKMHCLGKKLKGKLDNTTDSIKTKSTEVKNKVD